MPMKKVLYIAFLILLSSSITLPAHATGGISTLMGKGFERNLGSLFVSDALNAASSSWDASVQVLIESDSELISSKTYTGIGSDYDSISAFKFHWDGTCQDPESDGVFSLKCIYAFGKHYAQGGDYQLNVTLYTDSQNYEYATVITIKNATLANISIDSKSVYPFHDGFKDQITGTFHGISWDGYAVTTKSGVVFAAKNGKRLASSPVAKSGRFSLKIPADVTGKVTVTTNLIGKSISGHKLIMVDSDETVTAHETSVTSVSLNSPHAVYPARDGYKDDAYFKVAIRTSTGKLSNVDGTLTVTNGSRKAFSAKISGSSSKVAKWNGKMNGQVVPGRYQVTFAVGGAQGSRKVVKKMILVSAKKLETVSITQTYGAYNSFYEDQGDSYDPVDPYGAYGVRLYSSGDPDTMILAFSLPKSPSASKWRVKFNNYNSYGFFVAFPCTDYDCLESYQTTGSTTFTDGDSGSKWSPWIYNGKGSGSAYFSISSTDYASLYVDSFTIQYSKVVLR